MGVDWQREGLVGDRKYRQPGYQDYEFEKSGGGDKSKKKAPKAGGAKWQQIQRSGPVAPQMPGRRVVSRCAGCGTVLPTVTEPLGQCSKCGAELHSCKQCEHFDPSSRYECTQPIPERIPKKTVRNECTFFSLRVIVERETSTGGKRPGDARKAFENLFKK